MPKLKENKNQPRSRTTKAQEPAKLSIEQQKKHLTHYPEDKTLVERTKKILAKEPNPTT